MESDANRLDLDDRPKIENCAAGEFAGTFNIEIGGPGSMGDDKAILVGKMTAESTAMANPDQQSLAQLQASCLEVPMQIQQAFKKA